MANSRKTKAKRKVRNKVVYWKIRSSSSNKMLSKMIEIKLLGPVLTSYITLADCRLAVSDSERQGKMPVVPKLRNPSFAQS